MDYKKTIIDGIYTCVLYRGNEYDTSIERGVKPLLAWIKSGKDYHGYSAADKIVGKAAAMLYCLLGVEKVYAPVMSESAVSVFQEHGILYEYDTVISKIINRTNTGICPMEETVQNISLPEEAYVAIKQKVAILAQKKSIDTD